jgi:hypothetical protein
MYKHFATRSAVKKEILVESDYFCLTLLADPDVILLHNLAAASVICCLQCHRIDTPRGISVRRVLKSGYTPSPKVYAHDVGELVDASVNATVSGTDPEVGVLVKLETGATTEVLTLI